MTINKTKILSLLTAGLLSVTIPTIASAGCVGTYSFSSCYDNSGNSYSVSRSGGSTLWLAIITILGVTVQSSTSIGNTTFTRGLSSRGNSWSMTQTGNSIFELTYMATHLALTTKKYFYERPSLGAQKSFDPICTSNQNTNYYFNLQIPLFPILLGMMEELLKKINLLQIYQNFLSTQSHYLEINMMRMIW